ncbi:diacylglycerol kinase family protein [Solirubrobacter phytolaccae]|uniref:Diacylglycerol kinase family protein n=1 Tax=Solirubrobacter phytolaccae TaxID=1404360 RepID=A0A9X3NEJ6_9ACTN|nr:diacylglycerol kinase family protein [Solirubrobacter phytolaccae]MDA0185123.1 diacylglycerol kinase family protein [Solirubrobacter phytolaccae]
MRIALVANPASGGGTDLAPLLAALDGAERFGPDARDDVKAYGPERIVVAGGDGTIGSIAALAGQLGVPLAVLPTGTANDFARANGIPLDLDAALRIAREGTELRPLELGRLSSGRPFVNVASAGLSSVAGRRAQPLKSRYGPLAYGMGAVRAAASGKPLDVRVVVDQTERFCGGAWQIMVACTGAFGGGSGIGAADATDGDLDVVIVPAGTRLGLAHRAWGLRTKTIERQRRVSHFEGKVVEVTLPPGSELNCDGEFVDGGLDYVTATANAFSLVVA